jgi:hypothetical protein
MWLVWSMAGTQSETEVEVEFQWCRSVER